MKLRFSRPLRRRLSLLALLLLSAGAELSAQTSGVLASQASANWSVAPWVITAGSGLYPDGGGTATFGTVTNTTVGTVAGGIAVTLDVPVSLSGITFNSPYTQNIAATGANTLDLTSAGATFNAQLTNANTVSLFQLTNVISAPISGGGSAGLTKTGSGTITLSGANTYTGGTRINGGILFVSATAAVGDSVFGASGAGNGIFLDGGTLGNNITGGWTTSRDIVLGAGGGTILPVTAATLNGVISGSGSLRFSGFSGAVTLTGANTYTGATFTDSPTALTISGANGTINQSSAYDFAGSVTLSNTAANNNDRLSNTAAITSRGAAITLLGNSAAATAESAGALTLASGNTSLTVTPNAAQQASLNFASITRSNNSFLFVRGTSLGAAAANGVGQITSTLSPGTLIGGGGTAGSTNISILPWAVGSTSATTTNASSFVTWNSADGTFRPLATAEYVTLASGLTTNSNARLTAATAISAPTTVNSVLVAGTGTLLTGTGGLNVTSGAVLYAPGSNTAGTVSANLNFGSAEGVISNGTTGAFTLSGVIAGSGGLTLSSFGTGAIALTGANTYTGQTTLLGGGQVNYSGVVSNDGTTPGAFGLGTGAIVTNVGTSTLTIYASAVSTFNRDLLIQNNGPGLVVFGTVGTTYNVTMNGNITLQGASRLNLDGGSTSAGAIIVNGNISGTGTLSDSNSSFNVLNGNNTFSGGTNMQTGTYAAGSNNAFGTGTIYFSTSSTTANAKIQSSDSTARTISNDILIGSAGSTTAAANPTFQGTGALTFTGAVNLNGAKAFNVTNTALTSFTGVISNGALTKFGTGALDLSSPTGNTYSGGTVLGANVGALIVNNTSGSGTGTGTVSIGATSATTYSALAGSFTIAGSTSIAGRLSPGNSGLLSTTAGVNAIGTANFGGNLVFSSATTSSLLLEIASAASFDRVNVAGALTLAGTITIGTIGGYQVQAGDAFDFLDWGSLTVTGTPTLNLAGISTAPGVTLDASTFFTDGVIRAVPEPGTWAMIGVGALALAGVQLRRRRN